MVNIRQILKLVQNHISGSLLKFSGYFLFCIKNLLYPFSSILNDHFSFITKNSFAVKFGGFIESEISFQVMFLFLKLKVIPNSYDISLSRTKL